MVCIQKRTQVQTYSKWNPRQPPPSKTTELHRYRTTQNSRKNRKLLISCTKPFLKSLFLKEGLLSLYQQFIYKYKVRHHKNKYKVILVYKCKKLRWFTNQRHTAETTHRPCQNTLMCCIGYLMFAWDSRQVKGSSFDQVDEKCIQVVAFEIMTSSNQGGLYAIPCWLQ